MGMSQCRNTFIEMQNHVDEQCINIMKINSFVKEVLFKQLKFIPSAHFMLFSRDQQSLCQFVCCHFKILESEQQQYWSMYHRFVSKALNTARNDAVAAMKKSFLQGNTLLFCSCCSWYLLTFVYQTMSKFAAMCLQSRSPLNKS